MSAHRAFYMAGMLLLGMAGVSSGVVVTPQQELDRASIALEEADYSRKSPEAVQESIETIRARKRERVRAVMAAPPLEFAHYHRTVAARPTAATRSATVRGGMQRRGPPLILRTWFWVLLLAGGLTTALGLITLTRRS